MKNLKPIRKVTVGTVTGVLIWLVQWLIPAWKNNLPLEVQTVIPVAAAMIAAYLTKLESYFQRVQ